MYLLLENHDYKYAAEQMLLTLFPQERPLYVEKDGGQRPLCRLSLHYGQRFATACARLYLPQGEFSAQSRAPLSQLSEKLGRDRVLQRIVKLSFYKAGVAALGNAPAWGALTGIRPGKLITQRLEQGQSPQAAVRALCREYFVAPDRAALCADTAQACLRAEKLLAPRDISMYVGIPFCPSRCAYCSFVSHSVEKSLKLMSPYVDALLREIAAAGQAVAESGFRLRSLYIGGGTPTTLPAPDLERLLSALERHFDLSALLEYCVEAGRPDTVTPERLAVLAKHGVSRVSVNPQTMQDKVLETIGRRHTAADIRRAVALVRDSGPFALNMDLIAGLPGDDPAGFRDTLSQVLDLQPENVTVHTLALKRGSRLRLEGAPIPGEAAVAAMLDYARPTLRQAGFHPYYLYRQKFMAGSFENVGWALPGYDSLYNICIMEELHTILALGSGGVTKLTDQRQGRIERLFNPKYPQEYMQNLEKVLENKAAFGRFLSSLHL